MSNSSFVGDLGICPTAAQWESRQLKFRELEFIALGDSGFAQHDQVLPVTYELEQAFCAGAWVAVVILAHALVDVYFNEQGLREHKQRLVHLSAHPMKAQLEWLRMHRNPLVHVDPKAPAAVTIDDQWFERDKLYENAKRAVSIAFRFTLECSRATMRPNRVAGSF